MKLLAMVLTLPVAALAVTVEPLPLSEYADTEVSTNIAFVVDRAMMMQSKSEDEVEGGGSKSRVEVEERNSNYHSSTSTSNFDSSTVR